MDNLNLGFMVVEAFMKRQDGSHGKLKYAFICCGQYGGRQGDEVARFGYDTVAINTSESDLGDLKVIEDKNIVKLDGYNGAIKDIERGQAAIKDNRDKIIEVLTRPEIKTAHHVFVVAGTGGGTGNAAAPIILNNLARVRTPFNGKPSFGAILSVPGTWEKRGIKKNALWGLSHIHELVTNQAVGAICVVDNEKLFQMTESIFSDKETKLDWTDYGNSQLASLLAEVAFLTTLPASKTFDEDEWLDVLSTPGYLSLGKCYIEADQSFDKNELDGLIEKSFKESPTASDYDYDLHSTNGFMSVIYPKTPEIINETTFRMMEERFGRFLENAEKPHSGMIENKQWGQIKGSNKYVTESTPKAIIYTGAVCERLPNRIAKMIKEINDEEAALEKKRNERGDDLALDLTGFMKVEKQVAAAAQRPTNNEFDLFSDNKTGESDSKKPDWNKFNI